VGVRGPYQYFIDKCPFFTKDISRFYGVDEITKVENLCDKSDVYQCSLDID
jgi:hypothetical protein